MPDTVVPVVRRPVRRVSATPDPKELAGEVRKLSIGEDSSRGSQALRRTWNAETGRMENKVERKKSPLLQEEKAEVKEKVEVAKPSVRREAAEDCAASARPVIKEATAYSGFPVVDRASLPALPVARNRPIKTSKDLELERALLKWLEMVAGKKAHNESFERWIQDGTIVARAMVSVSFNSVPMEVVNCNWGASPVLDRVKCVIHEMRRYGVSEVFEPEDMMEMRNIPKVTRALARLCRLAAADSKNEDLKSAAKNIPFF